MTNALISSNITEAIGYSINGEGVQVIVEDILTNPNPPGEGVQVIVEDILTNPNLPGKGVQVIVEVIMSTSPPIYGPMISIIM